MGQIKDALIKKITYAWVRLSLVGFLLYVTNASNRPMTQRYGSLNPSQQMMGLEFVVLLVSPRYYFGFSVLLRWALIFIIRWSYNPSEIEVSVYKGVLWRVNRIINDLPDMGARLLSTWIKMYVPAFYYLVEELVSATMNSGSVVQSAYVPKEYASHNVSDSVAQPTYVPNSRELAELVNRIYYDKKCVNQLKTLELNLEVQDIFNGLDVLVSGESESFFYKLQTLSQLKGSDLKSLQQICHGVDTLDHQLRT